MSRRPSRRLPPSRMAVAGSGDHSVSDSFRRPASDVHYPLCSAHITCRNDLGGLCLVTPFSRSRACWVSCMDLGLGLDWTWR